MKQIVWRSVFLSIIAAGALFFSILHWYVNYRDLSQLIMGVAGSFVILYIAYDQWVKNTHTKYIEENYQAIGALNQKMLLMEAKNEHPTNI